MTNDDKAPSFKHKASLVGNTEANGTKNGVKIAVPLKYLSNFYRSLEMPLINCKVKYLSNFWRSLETPLINCKVELSLKWYERCLLTAATTKTFTITDAKLYVPIVTLSIEDNSKLTKLLNKGFKRPIYWNEYKVTPKKIVEIADANDVKHTRELLDSSCQGVKRLFVLFYNNTAGNDFKFLLIHIKNTFYQE